MSEVMLTSPGLRSIKCTVAEKLHSRSTEATSSLNKTRNKRALESLIPPEIMFSYFRCWQLIFI